MADRADRRHGRAGRGQHPVPARAGRRRRPRHPPRRADHRVRGHPRQPVRRRRPRLRRRGDQAVGDARAGRQGAARAPREAQDAAAEEARQHPALEHRDGRPFRGRTARRVRPRGRRGEPVTAEDKPFLQVVRGDPSPEEVAALVAV
ncbi:hypothetical protein F9B16_35550, partial [Actinomadura montaniterrae]